MELWLHLTVFFLEWLSIRWLCLTVTKSLFNELTYKTKNYSHSMNAQFPEIVAMSTILFLLIKAANALIMNNNNQIAFQLPDLQDHKSLTLHWISICHRQITNMLPFHLALYIVNAVLASFLLFSCTHSFITTLVFNNTYIYIHENIL